MDVYLLIVKVIRDYVDLYFITCTGMRITFPLAFFVKLKYIRYKAVLCIKFLYPFTVIVRVIASLSNYVGHTCTLKQSIDMKSYERR